MRIDQSHNFLQSFLTSITLGELVPAAMQRPYQWAKEDVEALCDSIINRFPIGGFLLWAPGQNADLTKLAKGRLGPVLPAVDPQSKPKCLLLDGQHRLATLAWLMLQAMPLSADYSEREREVFLGDEVMVLDHATRSMKFVSREQAESTLCLPAWTVFRHASDGYYRDAMQYIRKLMASKSDEELEAAEDLMVLWDEVCKAFMDARVSSTTISDASPEQAKHAFLRICRTGVAMSAEDFDRAVNWAA